GAAGARPAGRRAARRRDGPGGGHGGGAGGGGRPAGEPGASWRGEPLSNLDAQLRLQTRLELIRLHQRLGVTTVYVTHDQIEAMTMGHRIAVMRLGVLQQIGEPRDVYLRPVNGFLATVICAPPMTRRPTA